MEETKRKPTDYSASAVNLGNDFELGERLHGLASLGREMVVVNNAIESAIPKELKEKKADLESCIAQAITAIKTDIERLGSYQNLDRLWYAVKQRKVSKSYNPATFENLYPRYAPAVIVKAVDEKKLLGLIKGGLLTEGELKENQVLTETESFAYIIKV